MERLRKKSVAFLLVWVTVMLLGVFRFNCEAKKLNVRAVWVPYFDIEKYLKAENESEFRRNVKAMLESLKPLSINRISVQVRPFSDAIYPSKIFPYSKVVAGQQGRRLEYDPLEVIVEEAKKAGVQTEAWINPLRVKSGNDSLEGLAEENPAYGWIKNGKNFAKRLGNKGIWYDPCYPQVRALVARGAAEVVANYDIDSVQIDDYFYPTTDPSFDAEEYKNSGSKLSLEDWRRENINKLISDMAEAIKNANPKVSFGISPQGNRQNNRDLMFFDSEKWCQDGENDYICPQLYYGFKNKTCPFKATLHDWEELMGEGKKLFVGLPVYKLGTVDAYAGEAGKNEWLEGILVIKRQLNCLARSERCEGAYLFSYGEVMDKWPK